MVFLEALQFFGAGNHGGCRGKISHLTWIFFRPLTMGVQLIRVSLNDGIPSHHPFYVRFSMNFLPINHPAIRSTPIYGHHMNGVCDDPLVMTDSLLLKMAICNHLVR